MFNLSLLVLSIDTIFIKSKLYRIIWQTLNSFLSEVPNNGEPHNFP